jgi:uncharacterized protein YgiM (DUF1202 family)
MELEIKYGDIVYVTRKTETGWYQGTLERNGKVGFVPSSFLQKVTTSSSSIMYSFMTSNAEEYGI